MIFVAWEGTVWTVHNVLFVCVWRSVFVLNVKSGIYLLCNQFYFFRFYICYFSTKCVVVYRIESLQILKVWCVHIYQKILCLVHVRFVYSRFFECWNFPYISTTISRSNFANLVQPFPSFSITNHPTDFVLSIVIDMLQSKRKHK